MKFDLFSSRCGDFLKAFRALPFAKRMGGDYQYVQNSLGWRGIPDPCSQVTLHTPAGEDHVVKIDVCATSSAARINIKATLLQQRLPK